MNQTVEESIIQKIKDYGYFVALFNEEGRLPAFAYTIGLYETYDHPEIICFGLDLDTLKEIIDSACARIKSGEKFYPQTVYSGIVNNYGVEFLEVDKSFFHDYLGYASWYYDYMPFPCIQLVWCDAAGIFPWEEGFNEKLNFKQPLLDRDMDFKFYEEKNLGVFTTRDVLEGAPIIYVYHNEDGDWQFHSSDNPDINAGVLVALEALVQVDTSLNEVYHLSYGWCAYRESADADWEYMEQKLED
jgi:hypothetical protein